MFSSCEYNITGMIKSVKWDHGSLCINDKNTNFDNVIKLTFLEYPRSQSCLLILIMDVKG